MSKKLLSICIAMLLLLTAFMPVMASTTPEATEAEVAEAETAEAEEAPAAEPAAEAVTITIVHTNDSHGRLGVGEDGAIGFARIAQQVNDMRAADPNLLLLDAGDTLHGKPVTNASKGRNVMQILKAMGYTAMTPGNHDFNYGYQQLLSNTKEVPTPAIIASNVVYSRGGRQVFGGEIVKEIGGVKVGIFGLSTPETVYKSHPDNTRGIRFTDSVAAARRAVRALQRADCDVIVCLSHLGLDTATKVKSSDVARRVAGIDLIIDGHSHTRLNYGMLVNGVLIAQTGEYDQQLGVVTLTVADGKVATKSARLLTTNSVTDEEDPTVAELIAESQTAFDEANKEVLGTASVKLEGDREVVRRGYSNLGNLVAAAMQEASGADCALTNGGGLRTTINPGPITKADVLSVLPFGNLLTVNRISGANIVAALEHGCRVYPESNGGHPQVAGLTWTLDTSAPAGSRVSDVKINGRAVNLRQMYTIATNDFMAAGGDDYSMLVGTIALQLGSLDDIVADHIRSGGLKDATDVDPMTVVASAPAADAAA